MSEQPAAVGQAFTYSPSLTVLSDPLSRSAETIGALRTHILGRHVQAGRRALAICAPTPQVGCSFVAANLAVALAQVGIKTLLVDGDLREPALQKFISPPHRVQGLSACLAAPGSRVGDYIEEEILPNLSVLYAGPPSANASELLAREWFEDVMNFCLRDYEMTIIDTPAANANADARRICDLAGYGLVVARRNQSLVPDVRTLIEQIGADHAKVVGTVLNG